MSLFHRGHRALAAYVIAVVFPAVVLLYVGLHALVQQRESLRRVLELNQQLSGERLAGFFEQDVWANAEDCLRTLTPEQIVKLSAEMSRACPLAASFMLVQNTRVLHPGTKQELAARVAADLAYGRTIPGKLHSLAYPETGEQLFYLQSSGRGGDQIVAMLVDAAYAEGNAFARAERITRVKGKLVKRSSAVQGQFLPGVLFPFWAIILPGQKEPSDYRESVLLMAFLLAIGGGLGTGLIGFLREHRRQIKTAQLRANLVTGVAHELKTPLGTIQFFGDLVQDSSRFSEHERARFVKVLSSQVTELSRRIDNVLEWSRLQQPGTVYHREPTDLKRLMETILDTHRFRFEVQGLAIEVFLEPDLPLVELDSAAVTDAVLNLMENAAKYARTGGRIAVRVRRENRGVAIEVQDWGIGIPVNEQRRIFQPFYSVQERRSGRGGFGLGLFLVHQIMEAHGGRVEVVSEPGSGSTFRLIFSERCIR